MEPTAQITIERGHLSTNGITRFTINGSAEPLMVGKYIVADPKICHGKLTFRGTRIFVADVLEMVAEGIDWETIIREWHGNICKEAISEAITLAAKALILHSNELAMEPAL